MTGGKKLPSGVLSVFIVAELVFGIYSIIRIAIGPSKFLDHLSVRVLTRRRLALPLPDIDLDVFKVCAYRRWRLGELTYINLTVAFGMPSSFSPRSSDLPYTPDPHVVAS